MPKKLTLFSNIFPLRNTMHKCFEHVLLLSLHIWKNMLHLQICLQPFNQLCQFSRGVTFLVQTLPCGVDFISFVFPWLFWTCLPRQLLEPFSQIAEKSSTFSKLAIGVQIVETISALFSCWLVFNYTVYSAIEICNPRVKCNLRDTPSHKPIFFFIFFSKSPSASLSLKGSIIANFFLTTCLKYFAVQLHY